MNDVFFLVNELDEVDFAPLIHRHLDSCRVIVGTSMPGNPGDYRLIVPWNYRRAITELPATRNVVVFHSSDLPEGRGWAPIYHAIADGHEFHVVTGLLAAPEVDAGDILVKARFRIRPEHTGESLRRFDTELCVMLVGAVLRQFAGRPLQGVSQKKGGDFRKRRRPEDNEIDPSRTFAELVPHIRACEPAHPAWFMHEGVRYLVSVAPENSPSFPDDVEIVYGDTFP